MSAPRLLVLAVLAATCVLSAPCVAEAESRDAAVLFQRWIHRQSVRVDIDFAELARGIDRGRVALVRKRMPSLMSTLPPAFASLGPFSSPPSAEEEATAEAAARSLLAKVYAAIAGQTADFVRLLLDAGFATKAANVHDQRVDTAAKYRGFLRALFAQGASIGDKLALFALGNRFFEHCFQPATNGALRALVAKDETLPLVRLLYEGIAYSLARNGWAHWHERALDALKVRSDQGHEVVYVAGGTDIYRLLQWGIRRIRVIDPMFPSQARYYSAGWEFLLRGAGKDGGVGDEIAFSDRDLALSRRSYVERGTFTTDTLSDGTKATLPESTTVWALRTKDGKALGELVFERRFLVQADLQVDPEKALLVSFNELFFLVTKRREGWGIDPEKLAPDFRLHVKQLRAPIERATMLNLRAIEDSRFPYVFGTSVN